MYDFHFIALIVKFLMDPFYIITIQAKLGSILCVCCEPCHAAAPGGPLGVIQYPNNLCHSMPWSYYKLSLKLSGENVVLSVHRGFSLISRP